MAVEVRAMFLDDPKVGRSWDLQSTEPLPEDFCVGCELFNKRCFGLQAEKIGDGRIIYAQGVGVKGNEHQNVVLRKMKCQKS